MTWSQKIISLMILKLNAHINLLLFLLHTKSIHPNLSSNVAPNANDPFPLPNPNLLPLPLLQSNLNPPQSKYTKVNFLSRAFQHRLSQGISTEFLFAYKQCILKDKAHQLTLLYRTAVTMKSDISPDELCARFSEIID
jgi:hypothetical protein